MKNKAGTGLQSMTEKQKWPVIIGALSPIAGIISIASCCAGGWVEIILGATAIVLGLTGLLKKMPGKGLSIAGIIIGAFGIVFGIMMVFISWLGNSSNIMNEIEDALIRQMDKYGYSYMKDNPDYKEWIYGTWVIEDGPACYILSSDGSWGWYKDYNDLCDNYYSGDTMLIYEGQDAFDLIDMNEMEYDIVTPERFFILKLYVDTFVSNGNITEYDKEGPLSIIIYLNAEKGDAVYVNMDEYTQHEIHQLNKSIDD